MGTANKSSLALAKTDGTIIEAYLDAPALTIAVNPNIRNDLLASISKIAARVHLNMRSLIERLCGVCIAMSGVYTSRDRIDLLNIMDQIGLVGDFHRVACEDANAHLAANFLDFGGVVIASTGSNVFIKSRDVDEPLRVDGWGSDIGDDGSGYDLGRKCLRALFKAKDKRYPRSEYVESMILQHAGVSSIDGLIEWFYRSRRTSHWRSDLADLAIPLREAAECKESDPWAYRLMANGANALYHAFETAIYRINMDNEAFSESIKKSLIKTSPIPIILEGGLFENSIIYQRRFLNGIFALNNSEITWQPTAPEYRPVVGAVALAIHGHPFLKQKQLDFYDNLKNSAKLYVGDGHNSLWIKSHPLKEISYAWDRYSK